MNVAIAKNSLQPSGAGLAEVAARLPGGARVHEQRRRAYQAFEALGLPSRRVEDFKYTDLRALMRSIAPLAPPPDAAALNRARDALAQNAREGLRPLVLVDGMVALELSDLAGLEQGLTIRSLRDALAGDDILEFEGETPDAVAAYATAMATDGFVIEIAAQAIVERPLHIVHIATTQNPASTATRSRLTLGEGATATFVESFIVAGHAVGYQTFDTTTIQIGNNARLEHLRLVEDAPDAINLCVAATTLGESATYNLFGFARGGHVSRYQANIVCAGEGAHVATNGIAMLNGRQHADTTIILDHAVANCTSRETFRAVLDDRSHSVFQGRIIVRPHAQKTDAKMMTRALLLSDEAEADNKPELEIFADDVTCGHGATTGALDDSLLFYLRARGLDEKQAQALLIQAFVGEAIESIVDERLRDSVIASAERWLEARA
jgi:Fe-S cluster assembly protein SufD